MKKFLIILFSLILIYPVSIFSSYDCSDYGLELKGSTDNKIVLNNNVSLDFGTDDFETSFEIKINNNWVYERKETLFWKMDWGGTGIYSEIQHTGTTTSPTIDFQAKIVSGGWANEVYVSYSFPWDDFVNNYNKITWKTEDDFLKLYVNNVFITETSGVNSVSSITNTNNFEAFYNFDGLVSYFNFYLADNLLIDWKMDEGTGSIVYDSSEYENNGSIYNANWICIRERIDCEIIDLTDNFNKLTTLLMFAFGLFLFILTIGLFKR